MGHVEQETVFWVWNDPFTLEDLEPEPEPALATPDQVLAFDVSEDGDAVVLKAALPGVTEEEIDIEVAGRCITISGHAQPDDEGRCGPRALTAGDFTRCVWLPVEIELDRVTAQLEAGVLEVRAQRKVRDDTLHVHLSAHHH
ncbi:MAG: Hsp20/alpha crystallin family protein [Anaeromyxobacteraceae bacterium]